MLQESLSVQSAPYVSCVNFQIGLSMEHRQVFYDCWLRFLQKKPLSDFDQRLVSVIRHYPDFTHTIAVGSEQNNRHDARLFMLMGAHLEVIEQVTQNRPEGITGLYQSLVAKKGMVAAQMAMRDKLLAVLQASYQEGEVPDYQVYMEALKSC